MSNVMSMVGVKNKPTRSGFDLSRKNLFTAKVGEYLPAVVIECIPGDKHVIKPKWMTRTQPLNTAAYTRIKEYFDWYYVPTNLLWNKFNDFVSNMKSNNLKATSIDENVSLTDQHPYVTLSQIWDYVAVQASNGRVNFFGYSRARLTCKLLEFLGYGDFYAALDGEEFPSNRVDAVVNIFPLLAYQKIYQDHLRDSQWEKAYAPACNINYMTGASNSLNIPIQDIDMESENMFDLRYANWNKDYFMGVLPNSQYGDAASVMLDFSEVRVANINMYASSDGNVITRNGALSVENGGFVWGINTNSVSELRNKMGVSDSSFSILALRQAEAVQRMREVMQSHEQDYKSQMEARWNVNVSDAYSDRCKWLGGDSSNIDINEVVNTNLPEDTSGLPSTYKYEAQIKGKAVGIGDGYVQCNTDVHGYLVCIYHAVPILDFSISGVKKHNLKTLFTDYAQPELDKTGMVSIPVVELINKDVPSSLINGLLGYAPQYYEYKTAYDECHGAFYSDTDGSLGAWITPINQEYILNYATAMVNSGYNYFMSYYFLKIPPAIMDTIFAVHVNDSVSTDQLLVNSFYDIKSARNLDYNGLPY